MSLKEPTLRERKFCLLYLANGQDAKHAYIDAGYSPNGAAVTAHQALKRPHIKNFIAKHIKKVEKKMEITIEYKIKKLKQCIEAAMIEDPDTGKVILDNHSALLGAISELNKMQGHYSAEKIQNLHIVAEAEGKDIKVLTKQFERPF